MADPSLRVPGELDGSPPLDPPGTRSLTAWLLLAWLFVTFGLGYFARDLDFQVFGWPFGFWFAAQGGLVAYLCITWAYALWMDRLDRRAGRPPAGG